MAKSQLHLTYAEAEAVGAHLIRVWAGITGSDAGPNDEQAADIVQTVMRKAREIIGARDDEPIGQGGGK